MVTVVFYLWALAPAILFTVVGVSLIGYYVYLRSGR